MSSRLYMQWQYAIGLALLAMARPLVRLTYRLDALACALQDAGVAHVRQSFAPRGAR